ncbi:MAG: LamG domain-containing protein [Candidatus Poribacteria bacterium]|nr:LamG domain-containing protein [Candidatus Poribacteria bacterium]
MVRNMRVSCVLAAFLIAFCYATAVDAQDFVTDGLVAVYTLNEADVDGKVVKDLLGENDAELVGKLKFVEGATDGTGDAMEFEGKADNYVKIPDMGDFEFVSIECYALEGQFGGIQGIVSTWLWAAGKVHFKFEGNQIQVHKNDGVKIRLAAETDTWYHIIYTSNTKDDELKLYVDGELVDEGGAGGTPENMKERRIGSEHDGRYLIGMIDNVRIYDRILEEDEVKQNFESKSDQLPVEPAGKLSTTWGYLKGLRK